jgi:hypothetical protein
MSPAAETDTPAKSPGIVALDPEPVLDAERAQIERGAHRPTLSEHHVGGTVVVRTGVRRADDQVVEPISVHVTALEPTSRRSLQRQGR